jgi:hypothetical protein
MTNLYRFLWHPLFDLGDIGGHPPHETSTELPSEVQRAAHHPAGSVVQAPTGDVQLTADSDVQPDAQEFGNTNSARGNESSSSCQQEDSCKQLITAGMIDDDRSFPKQKPESKVHVCLIEFVRASGIGMLIGKVPAEEIEEGLRRIDATVEDLVAFLKQYSTHWKQAPVTWDHLLVSFRRWVDDPRTRSEIQARIFFRAAEEERLQSTLRHERAMAKPAPFCDAVLLLGGVSIPWPLKARLERTGELISPNELKVRAGAWKRCPACLDQGKCGLAIDRDLRRCNCAAGEEVSHLSGPMWPEREIERVHADSRSLIAAACYAIDRPFVGDAVAEAEVLDDGNVLEIRPTASHLKTDTIHEDDIYAALRRVRLVRQVWLLGSPGRLTRPQYRPEYIVQ